LHEQKISLVRNRVIAVLAANTKGTSSERFGPLLDELLRHITDEKPITARQCIQAMPEIAEAHPSMIPRIRQALENADLTGSRDSMQPLLSKDIATVLKRLM